MPLPGKKLYSILFIACAAGYIWLGLNISQGHHEENIAVEVCLIKHTTNIPCPSCGSTRTILALLHGNIMDSLYWNPLGLIVLLIMLIIPLFMTYDFVCKKELLLKMYYKTEATFRKRKYAVPAIVLILLNWIWNISKGL